MSHHHAVVAEVVSQVEMIGGSICGDVEGDVTVLQEQSALTAVVDHVSAVVHAAQLVRRGNSPHGVRPGGPAAEVVRRFPPHGAAPMGDLDVKNCLQPLHGKLFNDGLRSLPIDSNTFIRKYTTFIWKKQHFLTKSQGLPIAVNEDFLILQTRKCIEFPVPLIQNPRPLDSLIFNDCLYDILKVLLIDRLFTSPYGDNLAIPL